MSTSLNIQQEINQITIQHNKFFYSGPNMIFHFKWYNLRFFGWWDGHVDKYSLSSFCFHVILYIVSICAKLQTSSASPSILINLFKVATYLSCGEDLAPHKKNSDTVSWFSFVVQ